MQMNTIQELFLIKTICLQSILVQILAMNYDVLIYFPTNHIWLVLTLFKTSPYEFSLICFRSKTVMLSTCRAHGLTYADFMLSKRSNSKPNA